MKTRITVRRLFIRKVKLFVFESLLFGFSLS